MTLHRLKADSWESETTSGLAAIKILIVEDNVDGAESLAMILPAYGHTVLVAFDGPTGLIAGEEFQPDVVLLDIGLPRLDGYEVARVLRERRPEGLVIIAISGYCQLEDRERSSAAGIDQHLAKPVDIESLTAFLSAMKRCG